MGMADPSTLADGASAPIVPPPLPPDDPDAWYAPDVHAQYELHPGVVATIGETATGRRARYRCIGHSAISAR